MDDRISGETFAYTQIDSALSLFFLFLHRLTWRASLQRPASSLALTNAPDHSECCGCACVGIAISAGIVLELKDSGADQ
ncbi:hypothetical protein DFH06DRAFT_1333696 [Mycena polygramma]|nr:hypothetical protein DFH06DRAFT_1333696 [Mycena polygramma]